jgi:hypothetical protein
MTVKFELDAAARQLLREIREWSVANVRPLARQSETIHATPPGGEDALAACPIDVSQIVYADIHAQPTTDLVASYSGSGSHLLALILLEQTAYGDVWPLNALKVSGSLGADDHSDANDPREALDSLGPRRPYLSALAIGIGQASIDTAQVWLEDWREEFTPREYERRCDAIAEMSRRLQGVRVLAYKLAWHRDQGSAARAESAMVTNYGPHVAEKACRLAIDIMGPEGCSANHLVEKWYRDLRVFHTIECTEQIQRLTVGRSSLR